MHVNTFLSLLKMHANTFLSLLKMHANTFLSLPKIYMYNINVFLSLGRTH